MSQKGLIQWRNRRGTADVRAVVGERGSDAPDLILFPLSHGIPRVDDRRIASGVIFVIRNGPPWRDAPPAYGSHKTIYNRFIPLVPVGCP